MLLVNNFRRQGILEKKIMYLDSIALCFSPTIHLSFLRFYKVSSFIQNTGLEEFK